MNTSLGRTLRQVREQRRLSREQLSARTGVSVTVIRRIETDAKVGRKSVDILRRELGVTEDGQVLAPTEPPTHDSPEDALPHLSDAALWAEMQRRWYAREIELERLRAGGGRPLGVTTPVPPHLLDKPVARNAVVGNGTGRTDQSEAPKR